MRLRVQFSSSLLLFALVSSSVYADDLSDAFNKARGIVRDWKPSSSSDSDRSRDKREERSSQPPPQRQSDQSAIRREQERQQREQEKERLRNNLEILDTNLASARNTPRVTQPTSSRSDKDVASISARERQLDALMASGDVFAAIRLASVAKELAVKNAKAVRDAVARGYKPPFKPLWDFYKYNRPIALGLVPDENRCAIVMSMTLGFEPEAGEMSLQKLGNRPLVDNLLSSIRHLNIPKPIAAPEVSNAEIAKKYYVKAQELADRLKRDWEPIIYRDGKKARESIAGKKGIIFLQNAYRRAGGMTGDHLDLWDSDHAAASSSSPFEKAQEVWFWEIR